MLTAEVDGGRVAVILEEPAWNPSSDPRQVMKWSKTAAELTKGQRSKVSLLVDNNCLQYLGNNVFVCLPLDTNREIVYKGKSFFKTPAEKNYNRDPTPYELRKLVDDEFLCSCQWNTKMLLPCAHIAALKIEFKRKKFGGRT